MANEDLKGLMLTSRVKIVMPVEKVEKVVFNKKRNYLSNPMMSLIGTSLLVVKNTHKFWYDQLNKIHRFIRYLKKRQNTVNNNDRDHFMINLTGFCIIIIIKKLIFFSILIKDPKWTVHAFNSQKHAI